MRMVVAPALVVSAVVLAAVNGWFLPKFASRMSRAASMNLLPAAMQPRFSSAIPIASKTVASSSG